MRPVILIVRISTVDNDAPTAAELDALVTFLQADSERISSSVARKLHDDLGGCVIGAMMDVAWIEKHDSKLPPDTVMRLSRVNDGLRGAIDVTRKIVEELRPTLLDSMGLFAALSWHFKQGCRQAGITYSESFPASAPEMDAHRLITLFRIAQELFNVARQRESISTLSLVVTVDEESLGMALSVDGNPPPQPGLDSPTVPMLSILHRVRQLKGAVLTTAPAVGVCRFHVSIPVIIDVQ